MSAQTDSPPVYTVTVGVSATSKSPMALAWARTHAAERGGRVLAVRAWRPPIPVANAPSAPPSVSTDIPAAERAARETFAQDLVEVLGPEHGVEFRLVRGGRRRTLTDESYGADLLVIDAPSVGDMARSPLSVSRLVRSAGCPVVVMPPHRSADTDTESGRRPRVHRNVALEVASAAGRSGRPGIRPAPRRDEPDE